MRWFPDGDRIACGYEDWMVGEYVLRTYRVSDGTVEDLATLDDVYVAVPSPEGDRLAVLGRREGLSGLWVFDLATAAWSLLLEIDLWDIDSDTISWSPAGTHLLYCLDWPRNLDLVEVASGTVEEIAVDPDYSVPQFSPDGSAILYTVRDPDYWEQVWVYDLAAGTAQALTSDPAPHSSPQFSPDGRSVAYLVEWEWLMVQDLAGGEETEPFPEIWWSESYRWTRSGYL
ncbi:MAG: hypothetical protein GY856_12940, partial [bacterium]|nr:hypothetical protein [bacterium]